MSAVRTAIAPRQFIVLAVILSLAFLVAYNRQVFLGGPGAEASIGGDLRSVWFAAGLALKGDAAAAFDPLAFAAAYQAASGIPVAFPAFPYPPHTLLYYLPLAFLPFAAAYLAWVVVTFAAFAAAVCRQAAKPLHAALILLASPAALTNLGGGQNGFLSGALLSGGLLLLERRPYLAGVLFGLLTYKPQLGIVVPFVLVAGGYYRTIGTAAVTAAIVILISLLLFGAEPWHRFLALSAPLQKQYLEEGIGTFTSMAPSSFMGGRILGLPIAVDYVLQAIAAIAAISGAVWAFRKNVPLETKAVVAMVAALLIPPYVFTYDMCIVAAAQVLLAPMVAGFGRGERLIHAGVWLLPIAMIPFAMISLPVAPILLGLLFWTLLRRVRAEGKLR